MAVLSPFFMNVHFLLPSSDNQYANVRNAIYIATRPGVDRGELYPERLKQNDLEIHTQYMHERPGSHGLFSQDGVADLDAVKDILKDHQGIVWRGVVSLREDEAIRINHMTRQDWEEALQKTFPEIAEKLHMRETNYRWVAAYHQEAGHPHCHFLFWEENPEREIGRVSDGERKDIKKAFVRNIYARERERLLIEKTFYRDEVRKGTRDILGLRQELDRETEIVRAALGDTPGVPPRITPEQEEELNQRLQAISDILPGRGRVALRYMPEDVKNEVRETADWLLQQPGFQQEVKKYLAAHREITNMYVRDKQDQIDRAMRRAYNDLRDRISQDILKGAVQYQYRDKEMPEIDMRLHQGRAAVALDKIKNFEISDELKNNYREAAWTAYKLHEVMLKLGVDHEEVKEFIQIYAQAVNLRESTLEKILQQQEFKIDFIGKNDWHRLADNLGCTDADFLNPWIAIAKRGDRDNITAPNLNEEKIAPILDVFNSASNQKLEDDEVKWTISCMSSTLKDFGFNNQERQDIINAWIDRSALNVDKVDIANISDRQDFNDDRFVLGRDNWERLMHNIGADNPPDRPWGYPAQSFNLAGTVWKGLWQSLQRERTKSEYQAKCLQNEYEREEKAKRREGRDR